MSRSLSGFSSPLCGCLSLPVSYILSSHSSLSGYTPSGLTKTWIGAVVNKSDTGDYSAPWQGNDDPPSQTYGYCLFQAFGLVHIIGGADGSSDFPGAVK